MQRVGSGPSIRINAAALEKYCRSMPEYGGFFRRAFANHTSDTPELHYARFRTFFDLEFCVEEGTYLIPEKDIKRVLFEAYPEIASNTDSAGQENFIPVVWRDMQNGNGHKKVKDRQLGESHSGAVRDMIAAELKKYEGCAIIPAEVHELRGYLEAHFGDNSEPEQKENTITAGLREENIAELERYEEAPISVILSIRNSLLEKQKLQEAPEKAA